MMFLHKIRRYKIHMLNFKSIFSSFRKAVLDRLAPVPMQRALTGEDALKWLSQELNLDEDTIKKGLLRPGQNDWTIDPSDLVLDLLQNAQGVIRAEQHMIAVTKATGFTAMSIPWSLAFMASPATAWLAMFFGSGPLIMGATLVVDRLEEGKKSALDQYTAENLRLKNLFTAKATDFDRRHGEYPLSIDVEMAGALDIPARPIDDLYVKPKTQIAAERFMKWMIP